MKPVHIPRALLIIILIIVGVTFLAGVLHAFNNARASSGAPASITSLRTENDTELTPTPGPAKVQDSGDTTGIIALAILIVLIVVVGVIIGTNKPSKRKSL
jgi:hypothetical protein